MAMCENAYPGPNGLRCSKAPQPKRNDMRSQIHSLCGHQRFCREMRCHVLLPSWEKCLKRDVNQPKTREEAAEEAFTEQTPKKTRKSKAK